jgi:transposase-like protein
MKMVIRSKMKYRAEYCQIVEDWRKSGMSRADYCIAHNYHPNTFDGWIKKMNRPAGYSTLDRNRAKSPLNPKIKNSVLVPLNIEDSPRITVDNASFELRYSNGVSLTMSSLPATEDLLRIVHLYRPELCSR